MASNRPGNINLPARESPWIALYNTCICAHLVYLCAHIHSHTDEKASEVIQMYIYVPFYAYTFVIGIHLRERERQEKKKP